MPSPQHQSQPLLTTRQVQQILGMDCAETVYRAARRGELRGIKFGRGRWRFRPEDVERYLAERRQGSDDAAVDEWVERALAVAPKLSEAQRNKLAELLKPVRTTPGAIG